MIKPGGEILEEDIQNYVEGVDQEVQMTSDTANTAGEESCFDIAPASEDASFSMPTDGEDGQSERESGRSPSDKKDSRTESPKPKKKSFTVMLYPDEHEKLMRLIKDNGYKKVEYILACIDSAKKTSMEANYKRLTEEHARRRKADAEEAKKAREGEQKTHHVDDVE